MVEWRGRIDPLDEVTLGEAAELLNISPRLLRDLVDAGQIAARTNGDVTLISRADIDVFRRRAASGAFETFGAEIYALFRTD
ncbi:MAG TPA: helix-turn-helix domain-containing protein [Acidimicrobiales bacterium]|nr:helix-turn-helix domain-containing protein [Acidimicrobiales bacterium]